MGQITVAFQPSKQRFVATGRGDLVASDVTVAAAQIYGDPQFQPGMSTMWDVRGARPTVDAGQVRGVVSFVSAHVEQRGRGRCAVVTGREVDFGMARMASVFMEGIGIDLRVFRDLDGAQSWLDREGVREAHDASVGATDEPGLGGE